MLLLTIIIFVVVLLALVLIHEWGHFIAARLIGCKVEEFGFGFPPKLFSIKKGDTLYSFNALPIGGFVRIEGEDMQLQNADPTNFANKKAWQRIFVLAAGVTMNVVLAGVLLMVQGVIGVPTLSTEQNNATLTDFKTYIVEVAANSPAEQAGIKELDRLVQLQGITNPSITDIQTVVKEQAGKEVSLEIDRQGQHQTLKLIPRINPPENEGALGINLASTGLEKIPIWKAPWFGIQRTGQMLTAIVVQFWKLGEKLIAQQQVSQALTGPIGIAIYTNEATKMGASYVLEFAALISLNLALVNILPIPALDGGRILFVFIEKIFGRRLPGKVEQITHTVGFALLILLMILVTLKDIRHYF